MPASTTTDNSIEDQALSLGAVQTQARLQATLVSKWKASLRSVAILSVRYIQGC